MPFAVVDIETTGFSPRLHDRLVEIAVVRIAADGHQEAEYCTLVNPLRDVGPTYIHGITATEVANAPTFAEIVGDVVSILEGAVFVAHNAKFDRDFVAAELSMAGLMLPAIPTLCTLQLAYRLQPNLLNHKLATCCEAAGFRHDRAHSALEDARATARLLAAFLHQAWGQGFRNLSAVGCDPAEFPASLWPKLVASGRRCLRPADGRPSAEELPFLARVVAGLQGVPATERLAPYLDLLDRALEDRQVTEDEADALMATAAEWDLTREEVLGAHQGYLESVVDAALIDGRINELERRDLEAVTRLLALDPAVLHALIERRGAVASSTAFPSMSVPEAGRFKGRTVCFTGTLRGVLEGRPITRELAHELAAAAGLQVVENVSKSLDLLVVADPATQSGKAKKARAYGTRVMAEAAFWQAIGLQVE